jgi:hypothetical protein
MCAYVQPLLRIPKVFSLSGLEIYIKYPEFLINVSRPRYKSCDGFNSLVGESVDRLVWVLADLLIRPLQPDPHDTCGSRGRDGEGGGGAESDGVAWCVGVHP